jgi:threonine/homoserine/homoserine lactone efflux protein
LFFLSVFTVILNPHTLISYQVTYGIYMAIATALWFSFVSIVFSHHKVRNGFLRIGHWFDRVMGGVLIGLGIKLAATNINK